jgi:methylglyoxal synthase
MSELRARLSYARYRVHKLPQRAVMAVAWALPREVAYWAAIRLMAHATTGSYSSQVVPELTAMDALERWSDPTGGDRRVGQRATR